MTPLQQIPANVRQYIYWTGYIVGVISQGTTGIWAIIAAASATVSMPIWLVIASAILAFLQTQLNLLAGSNVKPDNAVQVAAPPGVDIVTVKPEDTDQLPLYEPGEGN